MSNIDKPLWQEIWWPVPQALNPGLALIRQDQDFRLDGLADEELLEAALDALEILTDPANQLEITPGKYFIFRLDRKQVSQLARAVLALRQRLQRS